MCETQATGSLAGRRSHGYWRINLQIRGTLINCSSAQCDIIQTVDTMGDMIQMVDTMGDMLQSIVTNDTVTE